MKNLDQDLETKNRQALQNEILQLRNGIRYASKQVFDSKCWLDYIKLNELLPEKPSVDHRMLSKEEMLKNCQTFINCMDCHIKNTGVSLDEVYEIWKTEKPY